MSSAARLRPLACAHALGVALAVTACGPGGPGATCDSDAGCQAGLVCVPTDRLGVSACMATCTPGTRLCADGSVCLAVDARSVCYLGGHHAFEEACTADEQCEPGTVCPLDVGVCLQACEVGNDAPCAAEEVCVAVGGDEGTCRLQAH